MAKLILLIASLVFLGIGVVFLAAPVHWATLVQIELPTSMARTDLRATYGGFDLGFGVFLLLCALRAEWIRPGLAATSVALAGFAGGRTLGMLIEGTASPLMVGLGVLEWSGAIVAFLMYRRSTPSSQISETLGPDVQGMAAVPRDVRIPLDGWRYDGSTSYGKDEFYHSIPKVVVRVFPEHDRAIAEQTFQYLKSSGVTTASIEEDRHVDGTLHFHVFAERKEFLSHRDRLFPGIDITA